MLSFLKKAFGRKKGEVLSVAEAPTAGMGIDLAGPDKESIVVEVQKVLEQEPEKFEEVATVEVLPNQKKTERGKEELTKAKQDSDASNKALAETKAKLEAQTKELATSQSASKAAKEEAQAAQKSLAETKVKLEVQIKELESAKTAATKTKQENDVTQKALAETKVKLETKEKELATSQSASKAAKEEAQAAQKSLAETKVKLEVQIKELESAKTAATKTKQENDVTQKALAETKVKLEVQSKEINSTSLKLKEQSEEIRKITAQHKQSTKEVELLLLQLLQLQEEIVIYYEKKNKLEELIQEYKKRIERIEKLFPNQLDFDGLEVLEADGSLAVPVLKLRIKQLMRFGAEPQDIDFAITIEDSFPGIGLIQNNSFDIFTPKLLAQNNDQALFFANLCATDFRSILSICHVLEDQDKRGWQGLIASDESDINFWRPFIRDLVSQVRALPSQLRYDRVQLKRELINQDYEHLWLELYGLSLGESYWDKFEVRIGAALVKENEFSQYPKLEIPLINGKIKPFDSWYEESRDESGGKFELRFSLSQKTFDNAVWSKLANNDRLLMLRLIYAMPAILKRLETNKLHIHRPWSTWIDFALNTAKILGANLINSKNLSEKGGGAPAKLDEIPTNSGLKKDNIQSQGTKEKINKIITVSAKPVIKFRSQ